MADPALDPRRLRHQLPAHHGRRRRHPGARPCGRGGPQRCRRAITDSCDRPRRAASRSTLPCGRWRGRRHQRLRAATGRRRNDRGSQGRRVRARARGRGPRSLPRHRRANDRPGHFQPDLHGGVAQRSQDARPGELRGDDADARAADSGIQRNVRDHARRRAVGHDLGGNRRLGRAPDDVAFRDRTDRRADGRDRQLRPRLFDPRALHAGRCVPHARESRQRRSAKAHPNRRAQARCNRRIGAGESSAGLSREPDHHPRLPEHELLRSAAVPSARDLRRVRCRRGVRARRNLSAGADLSPSGAGTRHRAPPRCGNGGAGGIRRATAQGAAVGGRADRRGARRIDTAQRAERRLPPLLRREHRVSTRRGFHHAEPYRHVRHGVLARFGPAGRNQQSRLPLRRRGVRRMVQGAAGDDSRQRHHRYVPEAQHEHARR